MEMGTDLRDWIIIRMDFRIRFYRSGQLWGMNLNRSGLRHWNT